MASKAGTAESWSRLVTLETFVSPEGERHVLPRIDGIERGLQASPQADGGLIPVLVLRGTVDDDGTPASWTVKTFVRTDHRERRVWVTLDVVNEPRGGLPRSAPSEKPLVVTVRPDPYGAEFESSPYEVVVQTPEQRPLARVALVLSDAA